MKILVDEMPKTPKDCPFCQEYDTRFETEYRCKYNPTAYYDYIHYCEDTCDCPYFKAIGDTNLAERVDDLEWKDESSSEEECGGRMTREEAIDILRCRKDGNAVDALEVLLQIAEAQPCEDAVSREAVLNLKQTFHDNTGAETEYVDIEDIMALPPVTPKQDWIPVNERLPENRNLVLVTAYWHETHQVMMASYYGDGLWWCVPFNNCGKHMQRLKPKAWMPLPEPYKEGESE